jgi:hypothetical protein
VEEQLQREEKLRTEMLGKLRETEDQNRQMSTFIKNLQDQGDQELSQMRELMQKKLTDDHVNNVKTTEKSNILFNEMVRLG